MKVVKDKHGNEIREGDVLKVFHFIGARRKKYYMYKLVTVRHEELFASHLGKLNPLESGGYFLYIQTGLDGVLTDTEIVQEGGYDPDRKLRGPAG